MPPGPLSNRDSGHTNIKLRLITDAVVHLISTPKAVLDTEPAAAALAMLLPFLRDTDGDQRRHLRDGQAPRP